MSPSVYRKYINKAGWKLEKASIDWSLFDEEGHFLCTIQIAHSKKSKDEVTAASVRKTEKLFKERGWIWPPSKKLNKN